MRISNCRGLLVLLFAAITFWNLPIASAQCNETEYRITSTTQILVHCGGDISTLPGAGTFGSAVLTFVGPPIGPAVPVTLSVYPVDNEWLQVSIPAGSPLLGAKSYSLSLTLPGEAAAETAIAISTTSTFTIVTNWAFARTLYVFSSNNVALTTAGNCTLNVSDLFRGPYPVHVAQCTLETTRPDSDPEGIGRLNVVLRNPPSVQWNPASLGGVFDIFGNVPSVDSSVLVTPQSSVATKALASWYFNATFVGATGSSPAWTLDAKVVPNLIPALQHKWQINPFVGTANVGQGSIPTATYTDTINIGLTAVRVIIPKQSLAVVWSITPGINAESDKEFDTWNLLGMLDVKVNPRVLYKPQIWQQLKQLQTKYPSTSKAAWSVGSAQLPWFGYVFEFHGLFEGGTKLEDTVVNNSDKSASLVLPQYRIARPGAILHGTLQLWRISADSVFTGRYLLVNENSVLEHKDKSLYLYQFHGWKGYQAFTGAYQLDAANHWALTVTYNNGFSPPKFNRSNSAQVGLLVKY